MKVKLTQMLFEQPQSVRTPEQLVGILNNERRNAKDAAALRFADDRLSASNAFSGMKRVIECCTVHASPNNDIPMGNADGSTGSSCGLKGPHGQP